MNKLNKYGLFFVDVYFIECLEEKVFNNKWMTTAKKFKHFIRFNAVQCSQVRRGSLPSLRIKDENGGIIYINMEIISRYICHTKGVTYE